MRIQIGLVLLALIAGTPQARADDAALRQQMQGEIDRVKAIPPARLTQNPYSWVCATEEQWHEAARAAAQRDLEHLRAVSGCQELLEPRRVAVLDFPDLLTAHVRVIAPDNGRVTGPLASFVGYTLPGWISDGGTR